MTLENPIKVYFESNAHAEIVGYFNSEEIYKICIPALEKSANSLRMIVTESIDEGELVGDLSDFITVLQAAKKCFPRHGLLSPTATDDERRAAIESFSDWWNAMAVPLLHKYC